MENVQKKETFFGKIVEIFGMGVHRQKISQEVAKEMMHSAAKPIILDVRTKAEYKQGHIKGALLIPNTEINQRIEKKIPNKTETVLVYCHSGSRSHMAVRAMRQMGYDEAYSFGGLNTWQGKLVR